MRRKRSRAEPLLGFIWALTKADPSSPLEFGVWVWGLSIPRICDPKEPQPSASPGSGREEVPLGQIFVVFCPSGDKQGRAGGDRQKKSPPGLGIWEFCPWHCWLRGGQVSASPHCFTPWSKCGFSHLLNGQKMWDFPFPASFQLLGAEGGVSITQGCWGSLGSFPKNPPLWVLNSS